MINMIQRHNNIFFKFFRIRTLKVKLYIILILSTLLPLVFIGSLSYISIRSILINKIEKGFQTTLDQVRMSLENTLYNLDYTSQQFADKGLFGEDLQKMLSSKDIYEAAKLEEKISESLNILNFTNPNIGIMFYYFPETGKVMFSNQVTRNIDPGELPVLTRLRGITYNSPHRTLYKYADNTVFSIIREADFSNSDQKIRAYVYIETNFKLFQRILNSSQYGMKVFHLLVDYKGNVVYSENREEFTEGRSFDIDNSSLQQYYTFAGQSTQGWKVIAGVKKTEFENEISQWMVKYLLFAILLLSISLIFAVIIWRNVYKPLERLQKGMSMVVSSDKFFEELESEGTMEFDYIIDCFNTMKKNIYKLLKEVKQKQKEKQNLELEKLLAQINPHFLHNSLNSIQWIARTQGNKEIDHFVSLLTSLLDYNLGKKGIMVPLGKELAALENYIELQKIRYSHQFDVIINAEESILKWKIPRFILQPLVENSIYHGLNNIKGVIRINIFHDAAGYVNIEVSDNGEGMSKDIIYRLLYNENSGKNKVGLGIGLQYVNKMIKNHYGEEYGLMVESTVGLGTTFIIRLPDKEGDGND